MQFSIDISFQHCHLWCPGPFTFGGRLFLLVSYWPNDSFEEWRTKARIGLIELFFADDSICGYTATALLGSKNSEATSLINPRIVVHEEQLHCFASRVTDAFNYHIAYACFNNTDALIASLTNYPASKLTILRDSQQRHQGPTNPAPFVGLESSWYLLYRDSLGVNQTRSVYLAKASFAEGPYRTLSNAPTIKGDIEDPFVWRDGDGYKALVRDIGGTVTGLRWPATGLMASPNGIEWSPAPHPFVCGRKVPAELGADTIVHRLERPAVMRFGTKTFLFFACLPSRLSDAVIRVFEVSPL